MTFATPNDTPELNALKALFGAPISMGRGENPVELLPAAACLFSPYGEFTNNKERFMQKNAIRFMFKDYPDVMSIDDMCKALSIGKKTGYYLLQTGQIKCLKIGRAYRIPKINILEYLQVVQPEEKNIPL